MNYATWKLNFTNSEYGTGPEETIATLGGSAQGAWVDGVAEENGLIIGYVSDPQDELELQAWQFENISQEQALEYCLSISEDAFLLEDGRIIQPWAPGDR